MLFSKGSTLVFKQRKVSSCVKIKLVVINQKQVVYWNLMFLRWFFRSGIGQLIDTFASIYTVCTLYSTWGWGGGEPLACIVMCIAYRNILPRAIEIMTSNGMGECENILEYYWLVL